MPCTTQVCNEIIVSQSNPEKSKCLELSPISTPATANVPDSDTIAADKSSDTIAAPSRIDTNSGSSISSDTSTSSSDGTAGNSNASGTTWGTSVAVTLPSVSSAVCPATAVTTNSIVISNAVSTTVGTSNTVAPLNGAAYGQITAFPSVYEKRVVASSNVVGNSATNDSELSISNGVTAPLYVASSSSAPLTSSVNSLTTYAVSTHTVDNTIDYDENVEVEPNRSSSSDSGTHITEDTSASRSASVEASPVTGVPLEEGPGSVKCACCLKCFPSATALYSHFCEGLATVVNNHQCSLCGEIFDTELALNTHAKCHIPSATVQTNELVPVSTGVDTLATGKTGTAEQTGVLVLKLPCDMGHTESDSVSFQCSWCGHESTRLSEHFAQVKRCERKAKQVGKWMKNSPECIVCSQELCEVMDHLEHYKSHDQCREYWILLMHRIYCNKNCKLWQQRNERGMEKEVAKSDFSDVAAATAGTAGTPKTVAAETTGTSNAVADTIASISSVGTVTANLKTAPDKCESIAAASTSTNTNGPIIKASATAVGTNISLVDVTSSVSSTDSSRPPETESPSTTTSTLSPVDSVFPATTNTSSSSANCDSAVFPSSGATNSICTPKMIKVIIPNHETNGSTKSLMPSSSVANSSLKRSHMPTPTSNCQSLTSADPPIASSDPVICNPPTMPVNPSIPINISATGSDTATLTKQVTVVCGTNYSCLVCEATFDHQLALYMHWKETKVCSQALASLHSPNDLNCSNLQNPHNSLHVDCDSEHQPKRPRLDLHQTAKVENPEEANVEDKFTCAGCKLMFEQQKDLQTHWISSPSCQRILSFSDADEENLNVHTTSSQKAVIYVDLCEAAIQEDDKSLNCGGKVLFSRCKGASPTKDALQQRTIKRRGSEECRLYSLELKRQRCIEGIEECNVSYRQPDISASTGLTVPKLSDSPSIT